MNQDNNCNARSCARVGECGSYHDTMVRANGMGGLVESLKSDLSSTKSQSAPQVGPLPTQDSSSDLINDTIDDADDDACDLIHDNISWNLTNSSAYLGPRVPKRGYTPDACGSSDPTI